MCVCLSASIYPEPHEIFNTFFVHVAYHHGSVLLRQGDEMPRGGAILAVFFPTDNALYGSYSILDFASKDRFGLNLLSYHKVRQNSISDY